MLERLDTTLTRVLVIDLDDHGNEKVPLKTRYEIVMRCLPGAVVYRSSWSGGLHLFYFLPEEVPVEQLQDRVEELLADERDKLGKRGCEVIPSTDGGNNGLWSSSAEFECISPAELATSASGSSGTKLGPPDISELLETQGVRTAQVSLPDDLSGVTHPPLSPAGHWPAPGAVPLRNAGPRRTG